MERDGDYYECFRCGWKWFPKVKSPGTCPRCRSRVWWKEKELFNERIVPEKSKRGGTPHYPFHDLEPGQSCQIPWPTSPGVEIDWKARERLRRAMRAHANRSGKKFVQTGSALYCHITRVS